MNSWKQFLSGNMIQIDLFFCSNEVKFYDITFNCEEWEQNLELYRVLQKTGCFKILEPEHCGDL